MQAKILSSVPQRSCSRRRGRVQQVHSSQKINVADGLSGGSCDMRIVHDKIPSLSGDHGKAESLSD